MKLSIIIPLFNEEKTISKLLDKITSLKLPKSIRREIVVVNDGSTDNSFLGLKKWFKKIKYFKNEKNMGKGFAIRMGLHKSTGDVIIIQDSDLEYDPAFYPLLLKPILEKRAQVVYGTRLTSYPLKLWGRDKTILPTHLIANKFLSFLTNFLYGSNLTDMETGYKFFKRNVLEQISLKSNRFEIEAEITAKILKKRIRIVEVPIKTIPRTYKEGKKIGWLDGFVAIWTLLKYKWKD